VNQGEVMETMINNILTLCSWCGKVIKEGSEKLGVSHGICEKCHKEIMEEWNDEE